MRIGLAQFNSTVGDLSGNVKKMIAWIAQARAEGCDLVVFPELAVTGYPPEDLVLKPSFVRANLSARDEIVQASQQIAVIGGFVDPGDQHLYNAAFLASAGRLLGIYHKFHLPNYGVFDERRYFEPGRRPGSLFQLDDLRLGISICEDAWYPEGPIVAQARAGAELLVNINGSPFHAGKRLEREAMIRDRARATNTPLLWVNMVGGQDELVFDGNSLIAGPQGELLAHASSFEEELIIVDLDLNRPQPNAVTTPLEGTAEIYT
ncbi:MAG: nitrilase-related carbon-nitrogen hydrolase, partial [Candidatus Dormibacteraceae bacterium]